LIVSNNIFVSFGGLESDTVLEGSTMSITTKSGLKFAQLSWKQYMIFWQNWPNL